MYDTYLVNFQNIVLLILQLNHTRSYSIILNLGSGLYALASNLSCLVQPKVSEILNISQSI